MSTETKAVTVGSALVLALTALGFAAINAGYGWLSLVTDAVVVYVTVRTVRAM